MRSLLPTFAGGGMTQVMGAFTCCGTLRPASGLARPSARASSVRVSCLPTWCLRWCRPAEVVPTAVSDWFPVLYGASFEWYLKRMDELLQRMHARCGPAPSLRSCGRRSCKAATCSTRWRRAMQERSQPPERAAPCAGTAGWRLWAIARAAGWPASCWEGSRIKVWHWLRHMHLLRLLGFAQRHFLPVQCGARLPLKQSDAG